MVHEMNYLFYFAHPAQFLFSRNTIDQLIQSGNSVLVLIKSKDVLENLVIQSRIPYTNILPEERTNTIGGILFSLIKRNIKLISILLKNNIDVMIGTDASIAQVGFLFRKKIITILEDDYDVIKNLAIMTYPFTNHILVPEPCSVGPFNAKKIGYPGYMKLAYLGPGIFKPNRLKLQITSPYSLIRLSSLQAHHDIGISGLNDVVLSDLIERLSKYGEVYICSEKTLRPEFEKYRLKINPSDIHHYLYFSEIFISDSQSMSVEAALLGVPSIRISDFTGRISVLNELETKYGLTYAYSPDNVKSITNKVDELLAMDKRRIYFQLRRKEMLLEKIDVSKLLLWLLAEYPASISVIELNPKYIDRFRYDSEMLVEL